MKNKDMLFDEKLLIEIFVKADDVCKTIESEFIRKMIEDKDQAYGYKKPVCEMAESEIMTLLIFYHYSGFKCFEYFYKQCELRVEKFIKMLRKGVVLFS